MTHNPVLNKGAATTHEQPSHELLHSPPERDRVRGHTRLNGGGGGGGSRGEGGGGVRRGGVSTFNTRGSGFAPTCEGASIHAANSSSRDSCNSQCERSRDLSPSSHASSISSSPSSNDDCAAPLSAAAAHRGTHVSSSSSSSLQLCTPLCTPIRGYAGNGGRGRGDGGALSSASSSAVGTPLLSAAKARANVLAAASPPTPPTLPPPDAPDAPSVRPVSHCVSQCSEDGGEGTPGGREGGEKTVEADARRHGGWGDEGTGGWGNEQLRRAQQRARTIVGYKSRPITPLRPR